MTSPHRFAFPTSILFGPGARKEVAGHLAAAGRGRPLVVTDRGLASLPVFEQFRGELASLSCAIFSNIHGNPVRSQVVEGANAYRERQYSWNPDHDKFTVNWMRVVKVNGDVIAEKPEQVQDSDMPAAMGTPTYTATKVRRISLSGLDAGTILDFSVRPKATRQ